jgi:hypothetical protein
MIDRSDIGAQPTMSEGSSEIDATEIFADRLTAANWSVQRTDLPSRRRLGVPPEVAAEYRRSGAHLRLELFPSQHLLIYSVSRHGSSEEPYCFYFYHGEVGRLLDVVLRHQDQIEVDDVHSFIVELVVLSDRAFFEFSEETLLPLKAEPL